MEMAAVTSALLRIFGYAKSQVLLKDSVDITVRLNAAIISSKLVRTVTPQHLVFAAACAVLLCAVMGKEIKLPSSVITLIQQFVTLIADSQLVEMVKSTQQMKTAMTPIVQSVTRIVNSLYVEMDN